MQVNSTRTPISPKRHKKAAALWWIVVAVIGCALLFLYGLTPKQPLSIVPSPHDRIDDRPEPRRAGESSEPQRIVVMDWNNIEMLLALGLSDKIVIACIDDPHQIADLKARYPEEFSKIQTIVSDRVSLETVLAATPDMIFARRSAFSPSRLQTVEWWRKRGVATYSPATSNTREPQTIERELQYIRDVGAVFGRPERASSMADAIEKEVREIQRETADLPPLKVLVLEGHPSRYLVSFDHRWLIGDFLHALGSHMIPDVPFRGVERLLLLDPDVIFVEYFDDSTAAFIEELRRDPKYNALRAVQNQRVYPLPVHLMYMPGPRTAEGLRYIAHALYPHLDGDEEAKGGKRDFASGEK